MIEIESRKRLTRNRRHLKLRIRPKHSNMRETTANKISSLMAVKKIPNNSNQT